MTAEFILNELKSIASPEKAKILSGFFKTRQGEYGAGDLFLGVVVPHIRNIAKANRKTPPTEIRTLLQSNFHEARLCALAIITEQFKKAKETERKEIFNFYLANIERINNWDLTDLTCPTIIGLYLLDKDDRSILYKMSESKNLWEQRISIVSTLAFIRNNDLNDTFALSKKLLFHKHHLIHKAVGWMLREAGKRNKELLVAFLDKYAAKMPRTALRYAIEKFPQQERLYYLHKDISRHVSAIK
ncbi:MAG: DNA alkylation repair protein [Tannerella sp.]|jgi:3-methyladenine DNA glycosylase AlkD|nr:DNA alkylation repair protein [Tannerella sp.]